MNRWKRRITGLCLALLALFVVSLHPTISYAAPCPYVDGGFGDGDGQVNGIILINSNRTITANTSNLGIFNCSNASLVIDNATLTLESYNNGDTDYTNDFGVTLQVRSLIVNTSGIISANEKGYNGLTGPGVGGNRTTQYSGAGGGYGGNGGNGNVSIGGTTYGSLVNPTSLGSGGGHGQGAQVAGKGGGAIKIEASEDVVIDGLISSIGGSTPPWSGAGSGGSIWIVSGMNVGGNGSVNVSGGVVSGPESAGSGAGGGGRISIQTQTFDSSLNLNANGGLGSNVIYNGSPGTIVILENQNKLLRVLNSQKWTTSSHSFFNNNFPDIESMVISNSSTLELDSGNKHVSDESGYGWDISLKSLTIESGSILSSKGLGHFGEIGSVSAKGPGFPGPRTRWEGGGGGHGGRGGDARGASVNVVGGSPYGSITEPITLGSGGGRGQSNTISGGNGGGAIKLTIFDSLIINGVLDVSGNTSATTEGGGGAGGSVWIITYNNFSGSGSILAKGGNAVGSAGSGGGGRISFLNSVNNFSGTIDYSTGNQTNATYRGNDGTFSLLGLPATPSSLDQRNPETNESVTVGGTNSRDSIRLSTHVSDPDSADTLFAEFEMKKTSENFTNSPTHTSGNVNYINTPIEVSVIASELEDNTSYHWQVRTCNSSGYCSLWTSFGDNNESEADFHVVLNQPPNNPIIPGSSIYINGQYSNDTTPTFLFSQSDSDTDNQVKYQIQINSTNNFSTQLVNYISPLGSQGTASFTLGQNTNGGEYLSGSEGQTLPEGDYFWRIRTIDEYGAESSWVVAEGNPAFIINTTKPTNIVTTSMKAYAGHAVLHEDDSEVTWFGREDLYFSWQTSGDTSILKGYCIYVGLDVDGDPSSQKGLLGTSPLPTTGSNCQFITNDNEIDFSNTALRGSPWLSSSNSPYYFKIRPIDLANNVGAEDSETSTFRFYFDGTPPSNVKTISASSGSMSSIADMNFYWPTSGPQYASDVGSGILGFQYAVNSTDVWRGTETDPTTGLEFIPSSYPQPFYLNPDIVGDDIIVGSNVLYFRTIDIAGNVSNYTTAPLEYGGEAPSFNNFDKVTVTPTNNTKNSFSFSWPQATPSDGRTIDKYFYMINTPPPALYNTITSNSSAYIPTTSTSIETTSVPNARKGSNTIYVVAVDDNGNYSQSNFISGNFTLNSTLPDPPQSIVVSDASVKSASLWRASLAWSKPDYTGTDNLRYVVQRSNDAKTWTNISETTGLAFLDTLSASQKYYWRIGAFDNSDESMLSPSFGNSVFLIPKGSFTEPADLTSGPSASSITTKRATINWTTSRASDSKVSIGTESKKYDKVEPSDSTQTSEHSLALNNLQPGTTYYYVAKWTDEDGNTGVSEEKTFITQPPPTVKDVEIKNVGIDSALIEFTTIGASSANINYGKSTEFGGIKTISTATNEATYSIQLSDLDDGTKYYFKIDTKDAEEDIYAGTILNFETLPRPQISNVRVQQIANTAQSSIMVTWESNTPISSIITFFPESNPEYARDAVDIKLLDGEHEMVVPGLLPETPYILIVKGRDRLGNEAVSDRLRFTTASDTRPPKISDLVIEGSNVPQVSTTTQGSNSQLIVTWTTDEPATSQVEFGEGTGTTYSQITQEDQTLTYNHLVIVSGLTPSKVYHLRAISKDSAGNIAKSIDTVTITPKATDNAFDLVITNLREAFGFLSRF